jgi:protein-tyrosine kinase
MAEPSVLPGPVSRVAQLREARTIGTVLVESGRLSAGDLEKILHLQREENLRFGDAGVKLGLLTAADIDFALSSQFQLPYLIPGQSSVSEEVVAAYAPSSPQVEALRGLRSQLVLRWFDSQPANNALAIISAERHEGRSFIAANLAVVFAQLGERTLLIDADLRNPSQHRLFGLEPRAGLSSMLAGRAGMEAIREIPGLANLSVLPAGTVPPNPVELLTRPQLPQLLQQASDMFDIVLLDSSASDETADAQIVAVRAGAALIVARQNAARSWRVQGISAQVTDARATVVGAVLNNF